MTRKRCLPILDESTEAPILTWLGLGLGLGLG